MWGEVGLPFALGAPDFAAILVARGKARAAVEPTDEGSAGLGLPADVSGFPGKVGEDALSDITGEIGGVDLAQRRRINEIRMPRHDLGKGGFGAALGVGAEQLSVGLVLHLTH